ncbi:MAG: septum site-determining protein MinC [Gammaproteobacteria bacterium]
MTASTLTMDRQACFQFKASFAPCSILQLTRYDLDALEKQITETIKRAPTFFLGAPIVIDLEKINTESTVDFIKLKEILLANNLVPMGVRNASPEQLVSAAANGLPVLTIGKLSHAETSKKKTVEAERPNTKLISSPVRSGMQIYAKETDLIIVSTVSAGAELLADGNIHVYGPLRGRALAGVQGNKHARIFCRTLEAELISIAGFYLTKEDMQPLPESHGMIQIYLDNEQVRIETIS